MISAFTPTHDPAFLPEVYQSLCEQTREDWEWVILLNGLASYSNSDPRVKVFRDSSGIYNVGFLKRRACELCTGDILMELDHDDLLFPTAFEECSKAFRDPAIDFVYSNAVCFDTRTKQSITWGAQYGWSQRPVRFQGVDYQESISAEPEPQSISRIWFAPNHFRAWRKEFYWRIGGHDGSMKISDDHDIICRSYVAGQMKHVNLPLYFYRVHGANTWLKHSEEIQTTMWGVHDRYIEPMAIKWAKNNGLRCLDLCAAHSPKEGLETVDKHHASILADLDKPWPFEDNSIGMIRAHDAIEHLRDPIHTMNEAYRVLAHGGFFLIQVPSTAGDGAWCDPTHVSFWNKRSFRYYTERSVQDYISHTGINCRFQKLKCENVILHEDVPYVVAHLVALKDPNRRFYGEVLI